LKKPALRYIRKMKTTAKPNVTVIVPAFNAAATIANCINSLLSQNYSKDAFEIIVVNDASTDNTKTILDDYKTNRQIHLLNHSKNRALAAARNSGIRAANGEIILFIDADITVLPDFISQHVQAYENPNVIGILSQLKPAPDIKYDKYQRYLYESKRGAKKYPVGSPLPYQAFLFTASSIRKSVIGNVGLFDEKITGYGGEDTEYAFRISQRFPNGLYYAPEIEVYHHHYRSFETVLKKVSDFGKNVVPYLIEKIPEFDRLYGYSYIFLGKNILKKMIGRIISSKTVFIFFKFLYHLFPYPLTNLCVRILLASSLWQGIFRSKK